MLDSYKAKVGEAAENLNKAVNFLEEVLTQIGTEHRNYKKIKDQSCMCSSMVITLMDHSHRDPEKMEPAELDHVADLMIEANELSAKILKAKAA